VPRLEQPNLVQGVAAAGNLNFTINSFHLLRKP
jgi:hypothetical protein